MGVAVLILGDSGSGKSTSLRNFEPGEIGIFNVLGKPLPFRGNLPRADHANYGTIQQTLKQNNLRAYVVDDAGYLLSNENFRRAKENGYGKFTEMAQNFQQLIMNCVNTDSDTICYIVMHTETDANGKTKPRTIGKMLDEKWCIEGACPIVLLATNGEDGYKFVTKSDGTNPVKAPMGMFAENVIDNDLKAVDSIIREYWGMAPISGGDAS